MFLLTFSSHFFFPLFLPKVSRIEVTVRSETFISVAYTLPEDQPSSNQQIRLGHFGSTLQTFGNQPVNNVGNVLFPSFPAVSPGDLLYASNAPSSDPTNYLNEIHFRYRKYFFQETGNEIIAKTFEKWSQGIPVALYITGCSVCTLQRCII